MSSPYLLPEFENPPEVALSAGPIREGATQKNEIPPQSSTIIAGSIGSWLNAGLRPPFPLTNCLMPLAERLGRTKVLKMADAFSQNLGMSENNETTHMNGLAAVIGEPVFCSRGRRPL